MHRKDMKGYFTLTMLSLLRSNTRKQEKLGFTLVEVMVAMLVLSLFILISLSAMVIGANSKLRSKRFNDSTINLQANVEQVRNIATSMNTATVTGSPVLSTFSNPVSFSIPVSTTTGFVANDKLRFTSEYSAYTVPSTPSTPTDLPVRVDLKKIKVITATLRTALAITTITQLTVSDVSQIVVGDTLLIGGDGDFTGSILRATVTGVISPNTINISSSPSSSSPPSSLQIYPVGSPVVVLPRVGSTVADITACTGATNTTFSSALTAILPAVTSPVTINDQVYTITRTPSDSVADTTLGKNTLKLVYRATVSGVTDPVSTLTTEVVPNVALQCP